MTECDTGCPRDAVRTITMRTPEREVASVNLCEEHGRAASNDRVKPDGINRHEFRNPELRGDPEKVRKLEPLVTDPNLQWKSVRLEVPEREPIARDTLERGYGYEI